MLDERLVRERLLNPEPHTAAIPEIKNPAITTSDHPMILPEGGFDLDTWTRKVLTAALDKHQGSPVRTADYLGVTRKVLYTLRKRHGLFEHEGKDESP